MQDLISPASPELTASHLRALAPLAKVLGRATNTAPPKTRLGASLSKQKGHGVELYEVRPYHTNDEVRHMDWRITARTGSPHTRVYTEEKEHSSHLCISLSDNAYFGTSTTFLSTRLIQVGALIGWRSQFKREQIGLSLSGQPTIKRIKDWAFFSDSLAKLTNVSNRGSCEYSFQAEIPNNIRSSSIIILSDQLHITHAGHNALVQLAQHNRVVWISVEDDQTFQLPPGNYTLKAQNKLLTSELHANDIATTAKQYQRKQQELDATLASMGIRRFVFDVNDSPVSIARQLLTRGIIQ
ncbi:hypothetical protein DN730_15720 [Marinomonas piezotolerans]|uniref:DUF58 domain-containing protein n=1 Tax=Marinomonas piezotolerans TaxID=2213058 RepID=A0A370U5U9_9GAMM|nr:DUF58 domain-containing protein [Marinomonas piezotolerans]RDL43154.1 hypothetical protein DN730_15720 [Marinomonas piezotolerans]